MTRHRITRLHVAGHRFLLRRMESALLGGDISVVSQYGMARSMSLLAGSVVTAIMVAACALLGLLRPQAALGDASIALGRESGALYVRVGETWHPALNLASARLIAATNVNPKVVPESELAGTKRGPLLGIPGAPQNLSQPSDASVWAICDTRAPTLIGTTVVHGPQIVSPLRRLDSEQSLLVAPESGSPTYLLYHGRRAVVNLAEPAVVRALRLDGLVPHLVSRSLLNAVPESPPITAPRISNADAPSPAGRAELRGFPIGSVLRVARADGDEYYVVLAAGVQRVGQATADLVRFADSQGSATIVAVAPDVISAVPIVDILPVSTFPDRGPIRLAESDTTVCAIWEPGQGISFVAGVGLPISAGQAPVTLSQSDGSGPAVDAVYIAPGRNAYVRAVGLSGDSSGDLSGDKAGIGTRYLIAETGVRFSIHDDDAAHSLGLPSTASPAPWPVLGLLPCGPELSKQSASTAWDVVATESGLR